MLNCILTLVFRTRILLLCLEQTLWVVDGPHPAALCRPGGGREGYVPNSAAAGMLETNELHMKEICIVLDLS